MHGLLIGFLIGLYAYFFGDYTVVKSLHYASLFWLGWYGLWQGISGIVSLLVALGIIGGGAAVGGAAGGMRSALLGGLLGGSVSLMNLISWAVKTDLLIGGAYLMFTEASNLTDIADINYVRAGGGALMMLFGVFMGRRGGFSISRRYSSSSSSLFSSNRSVRFPRQQRRM